MIYHCCFNFNIPMAKVVRHLFMYLFAICKLSLVNCPLISFASFLIGFFLLWSFKYFSYIQDTSPLSDIHSKYFLLVCNFYFHTLNRVFCTEKKKKRNLTWQSPVCQIFLLCIMLFGSNLRALWLALNLQDFLLCFFLKVL